MPLFSLTMHSNSLSSCRRIHYGLLILIALALSTPCANVIAAMLEWNANPEPNIAGYRVYMGAQSGQYDIVIEVGLATDFLIPLLEPGHACHFAVTAYDTDGVESAFSEEVISKLSIDGTNAFLVPLSMRFLGATSPVLIFFLGETGKQYLVQATADFQSWQTIHNAAVQATGTYQWLDADAPNHPRRFYRVVGSQQ